MNIDLTLSNTPLIYSSSEEEDSTIDSQALIAELDANPEKLTQLLPKVLQVSRVKFQQTHEKHIDIKLPQAEAIIQKAIHGKIVKFLSSINIFFVEVIKVTHQFDIKISAFCGTVIMNNGKKLVNNDVKGSVTLMLLREKLHLIFRHLHEYFPILGGKIKSNGNNSLHLLNAQNMYANMKSLLIEIEDITKIENSSRNVFYTLNQYCETLYHLCHDANFLKKMSQSTSLIEKLEDSVLYYPPTLSHMNLYLDGLTICQNSLSQFRAKLEHDYITPLNETIKEIAQLPKNCSNTLQLNNFVESIQELITFFDRCETNQISNFEEVITLSINNKCNQPLKACFESLEEERSAFIPTLEKMIFYIEEMAGPWDIYKLKEMEFYSQATNTAIDAFEKFNTVIDSLEKAVAKEKIEKQTRPKLYKILTKLKKKIDYASFKMDFNAFIDQSVRVPRNTFQEMQVFFMTMVSYNEDTQAFQRSLPQSSSAFTTLDLLILQIFQCFDHQLKNTPIQNIITKLLTALKKLSYESNIIEIDKNKVRQEYYTSLNDIVDLLKNTTGGRLKITINLLNIYLQKFRDIFILRKHCSHTILKSGSEQHEIFAHDLPLIQQLMQLIVHQADIFDIDQTITALSNLVEKRSKQGEFFWKLNFKYTTLAKLSIRKMQQIFCRYDTKLQNCGELEECLLLLHDYHKQIKPVRDHFISCCFQMTLMGAVALNEGDGEFNDFTTRLADWDTCILRYLEIIDGIIALNPKPRRTFIPSKKIEVFTNAASSESSEEEDDVILLIEPEEFQQSPYDERLSLLDTLQSQKLPLVTQLEPLESYYVRTIEREGLIQNSRFYLALIEEGTNHCTHNIPELLRKREQIDRMLLLESAEKIALASLRIGTKGYPNFHIISSNNLIYTHNGQELTAIIAMAQKSWFDGLSPIQYQESLLKKAFWFKEDISFIDGLDKIIPCWQAVCKELALQKWAKPNNWSAEVKKIQDCKQQIHKLKRTQNGLTVVPSCDEGAESLIVDIRAKLANRPCDPRVGEIAQEHKEAIARALELYVALSDYELKGEAPLFFAMRLAEIQVSLISSALILALTAVRSEAHPLFQESQHRPLFNTHRVDMLWAVLKAYLPEGNKMLDTYLPLFVGDPRYPLTSGKSLTHDLAALYEMVHLLGGWFKEGDNKQLLKYSHAERKIILETKIAKKIVEQQEKTRFALKLVGIILG